MISIFGLMAGLPGITSMRRFVATALVSLAALPAIAADMSGPPPVLRGALPAAHQGVDFTGFYAGGFAGFNSQSFGSRDALSNVAVGNIVGTRYGTFGQANVVALPERTSTNAMGFGLFVGYNWGFDDYVVGLEADYTRSKLKSSTAETRSGVFTDPTTANAVVPGEVNQYSYTTRVNSRTEVSDYGTIRARVGMPMGTVMPFATAGLAWARTSYSLDGSLSGQVRRINSTTLAATTAYAVDATAPGPVNAGVGMKMIYGYALGLGLDWAMSSNIVLRAEAMTLRFNDWAGGLSKRSIAGQNFSGGSSGANDAMSINTARIGAAVKF
jgi:outer membrane immunogenic protein